MDKLSKTPLKRTGARDRRANIACLESLWNADLENRLSVVPILDLVSRLNGTKYIHLTCNTPGELKYNLGKLRRGPRYRILYFSLHGTPGEIILDGGRTDLESLAGMMGRRFAGWAVHFGCCSTIAVPSGRVRTFMTATRVSMVSGYGKDVNWAATAALDLMFFDWLQHYGDTRIAWKTFGRANRELIARTGLRAFHA